MAAWIAEMNASYPALRLEREEVIYANCGLVPFGDSRTAAGELSFGKESRFFDHRAQGIAGLVTLIGIRYTTARGDAARALDLLLEQMPNAPSRAATESTPLLGGDIGNFAVLESTARREVAGAVPPETLRGVAAQLRYASIGRSPNWRECRVKPMPSPIRRRSHAELTHAVEDEMAHACGGCDFEAHQLGLGRRIRDPPPSRRPRWRCSPSWAGRRMSGEPRSQRPKPCSSITWRRYPRPRPVQRSAVRCRNENPGDGRHGVHRLEAGARCASPRSRDRRRRPIEFRCRARAMPGAGASRHRHRAGAAAGCELCAAHLRGLPGGHSSRGGSTRSQRAG